jgi:hypothetical protein
MADKYTTWSDADQQTLEIEATDVSSGVGNAGDIVALNSKGEIDKTMLPNVEIKNLTAAENLTAGDYIYIDGSGEVRLASAAAAGNAAIGYVEDTVLATNTVDVYFDGTNAALTGLTVGDQYFLSDTTPGGVTNTAPVGANKIIESVGWAISATEIQTNFTAPIKRA